ncbi:SpaA isopeptide-forming pilin-related protein [Bacillus bingmayongensis]|uniref:SpaA isopeptide-forming pilin-related protein n=1 Tax=Bacillus bingmayongensis TaxID=1150157 RepID=UPI001C8DEE38|nr:SpaA isopeptide-forming pilin-related protein [Bacillus bingmayongensis]MBY0599809.1 Cys-Gln thioester bond-forming surface protein [Bacillus bingmayongensis]
MGKKFVVRILALLSVLSLVFNLMLPKASAEVMSHEKYAMNWSYSNQLGKYIRTEVIKTANGQIAYCLTLGLKSPSGQDLPEMGKTDNIVYRVLLNGYPQKSAEQLGVSNWQEAHYATQLAVWNALGQLDVNELKHENKNVENAAKVIIKAANNSQETQDISMNVIPVEKQKAELKGDYFETNLYTVQTNAKNGTFKVTTSNAPEGVQIVNENGEVKDQLALGEKFRIQIPKATKTGEFNLKVTSNLTKIQAIAYRGTDTIQNATVLLERNEEKISGDLAVNWEAAGSLKVKKVGENNEVLAGAVFEVFNANGESVGTVTTNTNGIAELSNIPTGTYTVKEVKAPTGYVLGEQPQVIEVKTGEIGTIQVVNKQIKGSIEITKEDIVSGNNKLPGAEFTIYDEQGKEVVKGKTDEKGIAKFEKLPYGKYTYKETFAPEGYVLNEETFPFEIKQDGEIIKHVVQDKKVAGSLEIIKVDVADGNNKLPGAEFTIYDEQGKKVVKGETDERGIAKFEKLPYGKYTYKETFAPEGYVLNEETFPFEIKQDGEIIKHVVQDKKVTGSLEITKVDVADGNNKLPGAEFTIYDEQGKKVVKGKTDEKGIAKFEKLPYGKYTYKETFAPEGYVLNEETFPFEIKQDGEIIKHVVQDKKVAGSLEITKVDVADGNNKLPGAEFTIYDEQGKEVVKGKTNEKGIAKFEKLPYGKYTYKETFAPEGYLINEETFPFEIRQDGEIIKHTVKDKKKPEKVVTPGTTTHLDNNLPAKEQAQSKVEKESSQAEKESTIGGLLPATGSNLSNWIFIVVGGLLLAVGSILFMKRKNA